MTKNTITLLKKFFAKFPSIKYPKGALIHKPGDKFTNIYYAKSGYVRIFTKNGSQETTLNIFRPLHGFPGSKLHQSSFKLLH